MPQSPLICCQLQTPVDRAADPAARVLGDQPVVGLWPEGRMPGPVAAKPESATPAGPLQPGDVLRIADVSRPTLAVFRAPGAAGPAPAIIVCPGGGYGILAYDKEGTEVAAWLNSLGITALLLKYRIPGRDGAFMDIQRALRLARANAAAWGIDPGRLGVLGFSAGGHLATRASTGFATSAYPAIDAADAQSCRPDFAVLVYPAYLDQGDAVAPDVRPPADLPPLFIAHTADDTTHVTGSRRFAAALAAAGLAHEFCCFAVGGHGYGLRCTGETKAWPERCRAWLAARSIIA